MYIEREITPLEKDVFFVLLDNQNTQFDYPLHVHPELELNIILGINGTRTVGDSIEKFSGNDMVLIGENLPHCWKAPSGQAHSITIQFRKTVFSDEMLQMRSFRHIRELLENARRGIRFPDGAIDVALKRINNLSRLHGFYAVIELLSLLNDLSLVEKDYLLSSEGFMDEPLHKKSRRIETVTQYIQQHFNRKIELKTLAGMTNMTETSLSHFFKKRFHKSISDYILDIRIGHACHTLITTEMNITEICYNSGFNNVSNFNRLFKKRKGCSPKEFRKMMSKLEKRN